MSGRIPREFIDDLLVRADIVDLIDTYVPLKRTGSNFMARCPFHNEKTPSFSVSRKKQFYHCFGCGASGNAISFLMDYNHLDFVEAVEDLAAFVGVDVPREKSNFSTPAKHDLSALYQTLEQVSAHYQKILHTDAGHAARDYLTSRGVNPDVISRYELGFSLDSWDDLSKRFPQKLLIDGGMLVQNENGRTYDRFRGRLMFPIRDKRGRVIGFGGRVLDDSTPKYLNSPETAIFSKGNELYGLHESLSQSAHPERFIIVEGYMDVIALAQQGIDYAVATLGTATSTKHIETLFRFSNELVLCFDGDSAGQQAAWRAMDAVFPSLKDTRQVKIMLLPKKEDPDSLIRRQGLTHFQNLIEHATPLSEYFFSTLSQNIDLSNAEGRAALAAKTSPYLKKLPAGFFKDMMYARAREITQVQNLTPLKKPSILKSKPDNRPSPTRLVIALLLQNPEFSRHIEVKNLDWNALDAPGMSLLQEIFAKIQTTPGTNTAILIEEFRDSPHAAAIQKLAGLEVVGSDLEAVFLQALDRILAQVADQQITRLLEKEQQEGLTHEEKQRLLELLSKK
ncbi:DNA primase [methane-oxidizing endosymbiont of Gigantopelta aegis]|uniref:DNA primase n=1 Tax=methane-oxidizing endosymbiont of Gigantopelta aegis TaxID=2794938 RepID=UPI0018DB5FE7|nr:DNA primase [methane-oxidizing endosymbiont of Gigantopelta aegis]